VFTPCPSGWAPNSRDGVPTCEPIADGLACSSTSAAFLGDAACAPLGDPCPAPGGWSAALPVGGARVVYVRAGAAAGGDGSQRTPYATVTDALAGAGAMPDTIVALTAGHYTAPIQLPPRVTLWGACPRDTALGSIEPGDGAALRDLRVELPAGGSLETRQGLSIEGVLIDGGALGLMLQPGASVTLTRVVVSASALVGVGVSGATLHANGLLIVGPPAALELDTGAVATIDGLWVRDSGRGVSVNSGAELFLVRSVIERVSDAAASVGSRATLEADTLIVRDVQLHPTAPLPTAIIDDGGGALRLRRTIIERYVGLGLEVANISTASVSDLLIRDGASDDAGRNGFGIYATASARLGLARASLHRTRDVAVYINSATTAIADLAVADSLPSVVGEGGFGMLIDAGASASVERVSLARTQYCGMLIDGASTRVALTDLASVDTATTSSDGGQALWFRDGAAGSASRVQVARAVSVGVECDGVGQTIPGCRLNDLTVLDTHDYGGGVGILFSNGTFELDRVHVEGASFAGIQVQDFADLRGSDLFVTGVQSSVSGESDGIDVVDSSATLARVRISNSDRVGIAVGNSMADASSSLDLSDARIEDVRRSGLNTSGVAVLTAARLAIQHTRTRGIDLRGKSANLTDVSIHGVASSSITQAFGIDLAGAIVAQLDKIEIEDIDRGPGVVMENPNRDPAVMNQLNDVVVRHATPGLLVDGAILKGARMLLEDNTDSGLLLGVADDQAELTDVVVRGTRTTTLAPQGGFGGCAHPNCARAGIWLEGPVSFDLRRLLLDDDGLGIALRNGAQADLHEGIISANTAGVSIRSDPGYVFRRLADQVVFLGNQTNVDEAP
jgi:hypothetical protein